ncbi:hypothetical protein DAPPUDRAFT_330721 [Daphnia pulex]|uniref:Glycerol-3-phosphate dehydrogenase n=1 Tax=Daphnia pulex TaxID=6669 RepID=E9HKF5_DAPPU|nr:hypothetical protein DAPPUDRAFT_330721 [Daphnia pulex]|eukprot:EFX67792.1 hypothetical protein DAPPUDRAFT_330721 [Daphnia pulex]
MAANRIRKLAAGGIALSGTVALASWVFEDDNHTKKQFGLHFRDADYLKTKPVKPLPTRSEQLKALEDEIYDVLVIGGGATGAGCALDSVSRGLKTALVELDDFSSGTSSRSTKLLHGGVRYLQKAIFNFDIEQYKIVKEALHERSNLLETAPHLCYPLPIMLPVYSWWQIPYYWSGIKMYDLVAGSKCIRRSYVVSKKKAIELFPMLRKDKLCGAIVYYDGQHNDARTNIAIVLTATRLGATVANHVRVVSLMKNKDNEGQEKISGARVRDEITGKEWEIRAKCVINATGPFTDSIREMDQQAVNKICAPSSAIAGTTDTPCEVTHHPSPTEAEIEFILGEIRSCLSPHIQVRRSDVLSAWSGIRPLVSDPNKPDSQSLVRNHNVHVSDSGLVTIAGGKWTTYRSMAMETLDAAVKTCNLPAVRGSATDGLLLEGAHSWTPTMFITLVQDFGLESEVAKHLSETYGDQAFSVAKLATSTGKRWPIFGNRLHEQFPYIDAEVRYAIKEYACTAVDVIARRLRLAFLNVQAAEEALPRIISIMAEELQWSEDEQKRQHAEAVKFFREEMSHRVNRQSRDKMPINLSHEEISNYMKRFQALDWDKKGYISIKDISRGFEVYFLSSLYILAGTFCLRSLRPAESAMVGLSSKGHALAAAGVDFGRHISRY